MPGTRDSSRIPDWTVTGTDHNGRYLADPDTGRKTDDKSEAARMPIHEAVDAKKSGTITDYKVEK
jgi:hypothetical protein